MSKHHEKPLGYCCCGVFTIRTGVTVFTAFCLLISACAAIGIFSEDTRALVGGFGYYTRPAVALLGAIGVIVSLMSFIGLNDNHTRWVRIFADYFSFRLVARLIILYLDWGSLATCGRNMFSSIKAGQYNVALETVALSGNCQLVKMWYAIFSGLDIFFSLYGLWNTYHWCWIMDHGPMYNITLDDSKPLRIYTGYASLGYPSQPYSSPPVIRGREGGVVTGYMQP